MKKITYYLLLAGLASVLTARAQTNTAASGQPADNTNVAAPALAEANPAAATSNVPAVPPAPAAADTNLAAAGTALVASNSVPDTSGATNAPAAVAENSPLIQFSDVPITTAIEHLARQAGINYMLDPKIGYGLPDANGQIKPEPQLSIRWENITAESALRALLENYGLQLIVDKKTTIDRVTLKDPTAPPPLITRVIQLQYASVSNMTEAVQSVLDPKRSRVIADARTSQLLVVATDPEQQSVDTLIEKLDRQTKQVLIETKLIQISSAPTSKHGVDWTGTLDAQKVTFGNGALAGNTTITTPGPTTTTSVTTPGGGHTVTKSTTAPYGQNSILNLFSGGGNWSASTMAGLVPATAFLNADGVSAVISFLNASYDAQVVSTPRVVTLDNQAARIEVIRTFPIINLSGGTQNSSGSSSVTYSNVGTVLDVTPRISANDNIWLKVVPEVSNHFGDQKVVVAGGAGNASTSYTVPLFDRRRIESQVMIPNGNTLVMGGLVADAPTASYTKVPFLGDVPGLGWAFRSESKSMAKDNLIIFLTPTIVRDNDFQPTTTDYLQSKPKTMKSPLNPHTMWDGAEPVSGWDNPAPLPGEFSHQQATK